ncbi:MAG: hypothetical protein MMC23_003340 [Stictis urceolatum]|nr:hypothetical protein [Stictis urceolata]
MAVENGVAFGSFALPPLSDVSFSSSPQRSGSRRSSRHAITPPYSSSPAPHSHERDGEEEEDHEDKISALDPRRFTPTLHANLVSEILNLRREVESKNKLVLDLEENLSSVKEDNNKLNDTLTSNVKETNKMKRQMQMLEGGTMSALDELAQERDGANEALAEVKKRLEMSQKKIKSKEEDADRTGALWSRDQERWEIERRQLNHKVHVVEGRLKAVLSEIEAAQVNGLQKSSLDCGERPLSRASERPHSRASDRVLSRASGAQSSLSQRRSSSVSTDGGAKRFRLSHISEVENADNGATLADELHLDDEFDDEDQHADEPISPEALPEEHANRVRPFSAQSHRQSIKARKLLGLTVGEEEQEENARDAIYGAADLHMDQAQDDLHRITHARQTYTDTATQFSPPSSPCLHPQHVLDTIAEVDDDPNLRNPKIDSLRDIASDNESSEQDAFREQTSVPMTSSACQTLEQPPSPPHTPLESKEPDFYTSTLPKSIEMCTSSTQTEVEALPSLSELAAAFRSDNSSKHEVPVIAIHPPTSSHSNRHSVVLPPRTRNAGCQASIPGSVRSTSVQTEEIRIDQRPVKLPPHLLPSAISSNPPSPSPEAQQLRTARALLMNAGENADSKPKLKVPGLPNRSAKRVSAKAKEASTKALHSDIEKDASLPDIGDGNISDDSFITKEPIKKTLSKVQNSWKIVNHAVDDDDEPVEALASGGGTATILSSSVRSSMKPQAAGKVVMQKQGAKENKAGKVIEPINIVKATDVRKSAMISNGTAAHIQRARSPSAPPAPDSAPLSAPPPFPVPTRSSSRKIPWGSSDGTASPTPQTVSFFGIDQQTKQKRPPVKKPVLRKIRSATNDLYYHQRSRSRSPPPTSVSSFPDSPRLPSHPPLPNDDINSPFRMSFKSGHQGHKPSITSAAGSAASEQTSVVDAIAQTMIGEWMWKHVRRRTTFGRSNDDFDGRTGESANGVRHQRWVWLAPYERAVLWSSKQPTSGPALMGKSGRKLTIQSVLDVRDDAPMPKGTASSACFGRSILILTPQRALKFTATSRERHYIWLNALSFLSTSSVVPSELGSPPSIPSVVQQRPPSGEPVRPAAVAAVAAVAAAAPQPPPPPPPIASLRRHPIRDSIRIAKGKSRPPISQGGRRAYTDPKTRTILTSHHRYEHPIVDAEEEDESAAEAPAIPRTHSHIRKRSNTGPRPPNSASFRSFSSSNRPSLHSLHSSRGQAQTHSMQSRPESDFSYGWQTDGGAPSVCGSVGKRPAASEWATEPMPPLNASQGNFFDAMGTVRMEAFVKDPGAPNERSGGMNGVVTGAGLPTGPLSAPLVGPEEWNRVEPERRSYRTRQGRKKDLKYWGAPSEVKLSSAGADPFEGF